MDLSPDIRRTTIGGYEVRPRMVGVIDGPGYIDYNSPRWAAVRDFVREHPALFRVPDDELIGD